MNSKENIEEIITNPVYVGIGEYPKVIDDETWVKAGVIAIEKEGIERYFDLVFENLKEAFGVEYSEKDETIKEGIKAYENGRLKEFLQGFIKELRKFYTRWRITTAIPEEFLHIIYYFALMLNINTKRYYRVQIPLAPFIYRSIIYKFFVQISGLINPPILAFAMLSNPPKVGWQILRFCENVRS